jgi:allantoin racemase
MTREPRRVLVLVPFPLTSDQIALRSAQATEAGLPLGIELDYEPVKAAPSGYVSQHDYVLADISLLEAGLGAQEDGYDAVCVDTVSDSGVAALRSMLDIPVVAAGKSMYAVALMLGRTFGVLSMWTRWFGLYERSLRELGLAAHCVGMRAIDVQPDNRNLLGGKEEVLPRLYEVGLELVEEDGADVICLGSTTMHEAHRYLQRRLPVPVVNPGPLSYLVAEAVTALGLTHSRSAYPQPLVPKRASIEAMMSAARRAETQGEGTP